MNLIEVDINPVCPWKNKTEWVSVYRQVLSDDEKDWEAALHTLSQWVNFRSCLPAHVAASVPVLRARCLLRASPSNASSTVVPVLPGCMAPALLVNWAVRIAVIEFVNIFVKGVEAENSIRSQQTTLHQMAVEAGLPPDVIPLRNSLVHSTDIAATVFLHTQVVECMWNFLKTKYWDVEYLLLRRREEILGYVEKHCFSVTKTTGALLEHTGTILAAVRASNQNKSNITDAEELFEQLKALTLQALKCVRVFSSEGKAKDRDTRVQEVVRILVEELLLAPDFVKFLRKSKESCQCGCVLDVGRVPLKELLVPLLTEPPSSELLCLDPVYQAAQKQRLEHHHQSVAICNHFFTVLIENVSPGSKSRKAALEWLRLLLGNCSPYPYPPDSSSLRCPDHNLFLTPASLAEVPAPPLGARLRGEAHPALKWSALLLQMLNTNDVEIAEEAVRLLPVCVASAEQLQNGTDKLTLELECQKLRALLRQVEEGGTLTREEHFLLYPPERNQQREALQEAESGLALKTALLLQRQRQACPDADVKPCFPLGHTPTPVQERSRPFNGVSVASKDENKPDSTKNSAETKAPDPDAMSTETTRELNGDNSNACENSTVLKSNSRNETEASSAIPSDSDGRKNKTALKNRTALKMNESLSDNRKTGSEKNGLFNDRTTKPKIKRIPSKEQPSPLKINLPSAKCSPDFDGKKSSKSCGLKSKSCFPNPKMKKKRKVK